MVSVLGQTILAVLRNFIRFVFWNLTTERRVYFIWLSESDIISCVYFQLRLDYRAHVVISKNYLVH